MRTRTAWAAAAILPALWWASPGGAADLTRKEPYLVPTASASQMKVVWQLTGTDTARIEWGTDTSCSLGGATTLEYGADHQHAFTIPGLAPGTTYYFRETNEGAVHRASFVTSPGPAATRLKFFAYGDTRNDPATHDQVAGAVISTYAADPEFRTFTLSVGDLVGDGDDEAAWDDEFFDPDYRNIRSLMASLPFVSAMGNHEMSGELFVKYFPYPFAGGRYWSFDYGPAHFTIVDQYTSYDTGSAQLQWIINDLATTTRPWKFVALHAPGWSAGGHKNNTTVQTVLQPLFTQHGVSVVFGGHNHYYARAVVGGVQHITTGGGGAPLYDPEPGQPNVVATANAYHFCKIAIEGSELSFKAVTHAGTVLDSFTLAKSGTNVPGGQPAGLTLARPSPNPGLGTTQLRFTLPEAGTAQLEILDLSGRLVWRSRESLAAGAHAFRWDGRGSDGAHAVTGLYFVRLATAWGVRTQRLVWLR
jgi:hypothetical protein